jgi:hypothetical protein
LRLLAAACAMLIVLLVPAAAQTATNAEIMHLRAERTDEGVLVSAAVRFDLPQVIDDALAKGIPMYFLAEATLMRDRWYWYDKPVVTTQRHMRLSFQPLTRRWRLQVSSSPIGSSGLALGQTFDTRDEAMAAIQRVSHWKIADVSEVDPDARHNVEFHFRLDVSQLPRPFQIGAVGHDDWKIAVSRNVRLATEPAR